MNKYKEPIKIAYPVVVEGKYDKIRLQSVIDGNIITTNGFELMNDRDKNEYIRKLCKNGGKVIICTDSDGGGLIIRNHLRNILESENMIHLYIPRIKGKEKRKAAPSKEGLLGVEGISSDKLREIFAPFAVENVAETENKAEISENPVTKAEFFSDGLSGGNGSREKRERLADRLELPRNISANAMLEAINLLGYADAYRKFVSDDDNRKERCGHKYD